MLIEAHPPIYLFIKVENVTKIATESKVYLKIKERKEKRETNNCRKLGL